MTTSATAAIHDQDDLLEGMPTWRRWRRALAALRKAARNPDDTESVLLFSIHANAASMLRGASRLIIDPQGRALYEARRTLDSRTIDLDRLHALPEGTLGQAYAAFMKKRGLSPDIFQPPRNTARPEVAYLSQRMRQTHDLWHVLTGYETDVPGELELQAFLFAQTGAPSALVLSIFGTVRLLARRPGHALAVARAFVRGKRALPLSLLAWEEEWEAPLVELRRQLRCD